MALVGTFDASQWVEGNWATYPQLPPGVTYYQPTMHWAVVGAGTIQGQTVVVGDLLFATQGSGRLFGDGTYGAQIYGGVSDGDWTVDQVFFLKWDSTLPPPDTVPYPNAGCPFSKPEDALGDWAKGWRIVIDAYFNDRVASRTFGERLFGDDVFGDTVAAGPSWVDLTTPSFHIETGDGTTDGTQRVVVSEVDIDFLDPDGSVLDLAEPATWYQPQPGQAIRVGFIDPQFHYHPLITAEIERIKDQHDADNPRVVSLRAFGRIMDLTVDVPNVQMPAQMASSRFRDLVPMAGWWWDEGVVVFPPGDAPLLADAQPRTITVRDELDRTVQSCGWMLDSDPRGRIRVRTWPHEPQDPAFSVYDCAQDGTPPIHQVGQLNPSVGTVSSPFDDDPAGQARITADPAGAYWRLAGRLVTVGVNSAGAIDANPISSVQYERINRRQLMFPGTVGNYVALTTGNPIPTTTTFEIVVRVSAPWASDGANRNITSVWTSSGSFVFLLRRWGGGLQFAWSSDGSSALIAEVALWAGIVDNATYWLRFRLNGNNGAGQYVTSFEWAPDAPSEPSTGWTTFGGATTTGTTQITARPVQPLEIGRQGNTPTDPLGMWFGRIARVIIRTTFGGTPIFDLSENNAAALSGTTFPATTGQTMTVVRSGATIVLSVPDTLAWRFDAAEYPVASPLTFSDGRGRIWTLSAAGAITPQIDDPGEPSVPGEARLSHSIVFVNDQSRLLNWVVTTNTAEEPQLEVSEINELSVGRFGRRGRALDYPKENLPWANADAATVWVRRIVNRFGFITRHVESFDVDTALDPGWLDLLADLDAGRAVTVERRGLAPLSLDGVVTGWRHRIDPGRWTSTLFTSTTTPSM